MSIVESTALVIKRFLPVRVPKALPARPVWDEHITDFVALTQGFKCRTEANFEEAKVLADRGAKLKASISESWAPLTRAIDAIKQPFLDQRNKDLETVGNEVLLVDTEAKAWKREQDRLAKVEADRLRAEELKRREDARQAEIDRLEAKKQEDLKLAEEWGNEEEVKAIEEAEVHVPEVIPPRDTAPVSGFSYRKGARVKVKLVFKIEDPDAVNREFCSPDPKIVKAAVANWVKHVPNPTTEQIKAFQDKIGGGIIQEE